MPNDNGFSPRMLLNYKYNSGYWFRNLCWSPNLLHWDFPAVPATLRMEHILLSHI